MIGKILDEFLTGAWSRFVLLSPQPTYQLVKNNEPPHQRNKVRDSAEDREDRPIKNDLMMRAIHCTTTVDNVKTVWPHMAIGLSLGSYNKREENDRWFQAMVAREEHG